MKNVTESLAGRAGIVKMNSFTYAEIVQNNEKVLFDPANIKESKYIDVNETFERIFSGGMLELYDIKDMDRNDFYYLEIKKTANPRKEMMKNFKHLEKTDMKIGTGGIICLYDKLLKLDEDNYVIPISSVINAK